MKLYQRIALNLLASQAATQRGDTKRVSSLLFVAQSLARKHCPSGAGFDSGSHLDLASTGNLLIFRTAFHHMENGLYVGWTEHQVMVTANLALGLSIEVVNLTTTNMELNSPEHEAHVAECFRDALEADIEGGAA